MTTIPKQVFYVVAGMCFIAVLPLPYGFYTLLRLVVTGLCVIAAVQTFNKSANTLPWLLTGLALLFNPVLKVPLDREVWAVIDLAVGFYLIFLGRKIGS